ncbi:hypothetical protein [Nitrosopumilus sp. K4]|uniref:hypothetical protein n=1 Tax=Nitrosopumilus sp. K4 TaxID=2795383 RepID=UPI001BA99034|nr:hypothetical protein [Nitrosopumilus sp. K4]
MPDTLCRRCGGDLDSHLLCPQCRQPMQMICTKCAKTTEVQFHSGCLYGDVLCHTVAALA